jgi:hypothetical protein
MARHYEGKKQGSRFYSGEACIKLEWSQYACETHLQKQFRKSVATDEVILKTSSYVIKLGFTCMGKFDDNGELACK